MKKLVILSALAVVSFAGGHKVEPVNAAYQKECGSCHTAYQPEFLPRNSWNRLINEQNNHFGEDLALSSAKANELKAFLFSRSADVSTNKTARRFASTQGIKISENPYFVKEHRRIGSAELKKQGLKSFANCSSCHKLADQGNYDEQ